MKKKEIKIIYIEIDEELTSLIDRIKNSHETNIRIVIPKRASILQSVVNLKLLKNQAEKIGKEISLITTDKTGRNLASQVGLTVYQSLDTDVRNLEDDGLNESIKKLDEWVEKNEPGEEKEFGRKLTLSETLKKNRMRYFEKEKRYEGEKKEHISPISDSTEDNIETVEMISPNKRILTFLFGLSVILLAGIGYFVLPNATVQVQPKIEKISYTTNLSLIDADRYKSVLEEGKKLKLVGSYPIEISELSYSKEYQTTGERFTGKTPSGRIRVINTVPQAWKFVSRTRFKSDDGVIYRIQDPVNIGGNAVVEADVIADEFDEAGKPIGDRGNFKKGTRLIIPGLRGDSQSKVYGEVMEDITNGVSSVTKTLTKEDILAAKANIVDELFKIAETKLRERIEEENKSSGLNLKLFISRDVESVTKEVIGVTAPDDLIGKDMTIFQVQAKIKIKGTAYDSNAILEIMKDGLSVKVLEDRLLKDVKGDEIEFNVVEKNDEERKIKVETTINGITEYKVNSKLGDKIRGKILNKSLEESAKIIKDMPEIGEVRIETWPFWVSKIPGVRSNIVVERL